MHKLDDLERNAGKLGYGPLLPRTTVSTRSEPKPESEVLWGEGRLVGIKPNSHRARADPHERADSSSASSSTGTGHVACKEAAREMPTWTMTTRIDAPPMCFATSREPAVPSGIASPCRCLLYTSDAADEEDSVDLGGRRIIK